MGKAKEAMQDVSNQVWIFGIDNIDIDGMIENILCEGVAEIPLMVNSTSDTVTKLYMPKFNDEVIKVYAAYRQCYAPGEVMEDAINVDLDSKDSWGMEIIDRHKDFLSEIIMHSSIAGIQRQHNIINSISHIEKFDEGKPTTLYEVLTSKVSGLSIAWAGYLTRLEFIQKYMRHSSALEHFHITMNLGDVSRSMTHQLVRHRIASFSQQSQRHAEHDHNFIIPNSIANNEIANGVYLSCMTTIKDSFDLLKELNIPVEDARYVFPNGYTSDIVCTFNVRSLENFFRERCCNRAQWEIRSHAWELLNKLRRNVPILFDDMGPDCITDKCKEHKPCGEPYKK